MKQDYLNIWKILLDLINMLNKLKRFNNKWKKKMMKELKKQIELKLHKLN